MNSPLLNVRYTVLHPLLEEFPPAYATDGAAALDLRACLDEPEILVEPGQRAKVRTGLAIQIETPGVAAFVTARSGLGAKHGLTVAQGVGLIDPDYRGEILVWLLNTSQTPRTVARGERVAQLIFLPYYHAQLIRVQELDETARGDGGFGHTGSR